VVPAGPLAAPMDTFSKTLSSDQYTSIFAANPQVLASPEIANQGFPFDPAPLRPDAFGIAKTPTVLNGSAPPPVTNPRSCTTCRKRKVRCDKKHPCSNCHKAGIECVFPRPGRAPRRNKKPPDSELLARLRRLEGVVQSLGKGLDGEDLPPDATGAVDNKDGSLPEEKGEEKAGQLKACPSRSKGAADGTGLEKEMGRLFVGDGRSRYVSNNFWASLTSQVRCLTRSTNVEHCFSMISWVTYRRGTLTNVY
jgi:hypothetical protein